MTPEEKIKQLETELEKERLAHKKTLADLEFQQLVSHAWECMVDLAEETYHIKIKKLRCRVIEETVKEKIDKAILMYNTVRPHQSLGMKTPMSVASY